jgi:hypothetical protein
MTLNAFIQGVIVAAMVLWAGWIAFGKLMPRARTRAIRALADQLEQPSRPQWSRDLASRLRPPPDKASGCGSGCSSCDSCGSSSPVTKAAEQPLNFVPRK